MTEGRRKYQRYPKLEEVKIHLPHELGERLERYGILDPEVDPSLMALFLLLSPQPEAQALGNELETFLIGLTIRPEKSEEVQ
jgi:hypothetical protein